MCYFYSVCTYLFNTLHVHARILRGRGPDPPPLENYNIIGFFSNTGPDPLENHKATKPEFIVGPLSTRQRNAI